MARIIATNNNRAEERRNLALLLPARDEELILRATILSAIRAGQRREDIYVVDDGSKDATRQEALKELPKANVLKVRNGGKARAVMKAIKKFRIKSRYTWLHVADADSLFCHNYFDIYSKKLQGDKYSAAIGFVQSQYGNWISKYRVFSYTYGQQVFRRIQSWLGVISVFPGPVTSFRTSIIKHLDFSVQSLTEDFDLTLQFHRKRLGKIAYITEAVNYTQDPLTLKDFVKQSSRWYRGFFQGVTRHKIGRRIMLIDVGIGYQILEAAIYVLQLWVLVPVVGIITGKWLMVPMMLLGDMAIMTVFAVYSSLAASRPSILAALPSFYMLRALELFIFIWSFIEVVVLKKFRGETNGWQTKGRRYKVSSRTLQEVMDEAV